LEKFSHRKSIGRGQLDKVLLEEGDLPGEESCLCQQVLFLGRICGRFGLIVESTRTALEEAQLLLDRPGGCENVVESLLTPVVEICLAVRLGD
jgi:hypothetical protein